MGGVVDGRGEGWSIGTRTRTRTTTHTHLPKHHSRIYACTPKPSIPARININTAIRLPMPSFISHHPVPHRRPSVWHMTAVATTPCGVQRTWRGEWSSWGGTVRMGESGCVAGGYGEGKQEVVSAARVCIGDPYNDSIYTPHTAPHPLSPPPQPRACTQRSGPPL